MLSLKALNNNELENVVGGGEKYGYTNGVKNTAKAILPFCTPETVTGVNKDAGYFSQIKGQFGNIDGGLKKAAVAGTIAGVPVVVAGLAYGGYRLMRKYVFKNKK